MTPAKKTATDAPARAPKKATAKAATGKGVTAKAATAKGVTAKAATAKAATGKGATATKTRTKDLPPPTDPRAVSHTVPPQVDDALAAIWHSFKSDDDAGARERLILHYAPLVKYVASRVATGLPASVDQADLVSYGMFGLIDALQKFEPGRGNKFETYAIPRIRGAIIDELRAMDWVPRSVRFKQREIEKALADLESMLKRQPTDKELAERLGMSLQELHEVITQISFVSVLALDETVSVGADRGEKVSLVDTLADKGFDPSTGVESQETRGLLAAAINELSEREKIVVTLYYFEGLTLAEIGEILGVTESRVCQIHTKAVGVLRGQMTEYD